MKKQSATPLSREAEAFIEMLAAERGASKNTEAAYSADLRNLEAFLARRKQKPVTANADALRSEEHRLNSSHQSTSRMPSSA